VVQFGSVNSPKLHHLLVTAGRSRPRRWQRLTPVRQSVRVICRSSDEIAGTSSAGHHEPS
jgi:hypothetical protein